MATQFDPYHKWLGIPPKDQPPHYYRLLGLETFEQDADVIDAAADRVMGYLRQFGTGPHSDDSQRLLNEVSTARVCLVQPEKRSVYDAQLRQQQAAMAPPPGLPTGNLPSAPNAPPMPPATVAPRSPSAPHLGASLPPHAHPGPAAAPPRQPRSSSSLEFDVERDPMARYKRKSNLPTLVGVVALVLVIGGAALVVIPGGPFAQATSDPATKGDDLAVADAKQTPDRSQEEIKPEPVARTAEPHESDPAMPVQPEPEPESRPDPVTEPAPTPESPPETPTEPQPVDLLATVDTERDAVGGHWELANHLLIGPAEPYAVLMLPGSIPAQYDLRIEARRLVGNNGIAIGLVAGETQFVVVLDAYRGTVSGFDRFDGEPIGLNETITPARIFIGDAPVTLECSVRRDKIRISVGGRTVLETSERSRLSLGPYWKVPEPQRLFLGSIGGAFEFRTVSLLPVESTEELTRPLPEPLAVGPQPRSPIPPEQDVMAARTLVRETFDDEFLAAKTPPQKLVLARKLIEHGDETRDDPAARYALYQEAGELAQSINHTDTSYQAIDRMADRFQLGPQQQVERKTEVLKGLTRLAKTPADQKLLTQRYLQLVSEAVDLDQYEQATQILSLASVAARKSTDKTLQSRVKDFPTTIAALSEQGELARAAVAALEEDPFDADACQIRGRFLCVLKGDWASGLPLLAGGNNDVWAAQAAADLASPDEAESQLAVADGWFELAGTLEGPPAVELKRRSFHWYNKSVARLAGLNKTRIEKRLKELAADNDVVRGNRLSAPTRPDIPIGPIKAISSREQVSGITVLPDNHTVVLWNGRSDYFATVDLLTERPVAQYQNESARVNRLAVTPDGSAALVVDDDRNFRYFDLGTRRILTRFAGPVTRRWIGSLTLTNDGRRAMFSTEDTLRVWDLETGQESLAIPADNAGLQVAFTRDGKRALSRSRSMEDGSERLQLWDLTNGKPLLTFNPFRERARLNGVALSPDGTKAVTTFDREGLPIALWDVKTGEHIRDFEGHVGEVRHALFTPDSGRVVSAGDDGTLRLWNVATGLELEKFSGHTARVETLALAPNGYLAVTAENAQGGTRVMLWGLP